jgi:hypothetical protein
MLTILIGVILRRRSVQLATDEPREPENGEFAFAFQVLRDIPIEETSDD